MDTLQLSLTCAGSPFVFATPKCIGKPVDFVRILHSSICSEESFDMVQSLQYWRNNMALKLSSADAGCEEKLKSIDDYVPHILLFFNSLKNQPSVRLDAEMIFEWLGSFSSDKKGHRFPDIIFEVIMTLHSKAIQHYCIGRHLLKSDHVQNISNAARNFNAAAGVMDYIASTILPQWITAAKRPPEADIVVCQAMADFFTAESQHMAVAREVLKGGPPSALTVKICIAALRAADEGIDRLETVSRSELCFYSDGPTFNRNFYAALVYYYSGELTRIKDNNVGIALSYFRESLDKINDKFNGIKGNSKAFEAICSQSPTIKDGVLYLLHIIETSKATATRENEMIYFQPVPAGRDLPPLPTGILVMPKKMYSPVFNESIIMLRFDGSRYTIPVGTRWTPTIAVVPSAPPSYFSP